MLGCLSLNSAGIGCPLKPLIMTVSLILRSTSDNNFQFNSKVPIEGEKHALQSKEGSTCLF